MELAYFIIFAVALLQIILKKGLQYGTVSSAYCDSYLLAII